MANLRLAMDAAFWDLNVSSPQSLDGTVRAVPGEPAPLDLARASRTVRPVQLSILGNGFPLGLIPSFAPVPVPVPVPVPAPADNSLGSFAVQSMLLRPSAANWWLGLVGQFRPRKLISNIKKELTADELDWNVFKKVGKHFVDKSHYALGLFSQVALTEDTSLLFNVERHGERKKRRSKAMLVHKLPNHDVTLEAAWPELFVDRHGTYWDVPSSVSLDIASLVSDSGLRYRFGLHKGDGYPEAVNSSSGEVPLTLMPGTCAKAAFSYEKTRDLWREREENRTKSREAEEKPAWLRPYDVRLKEPHAAISGIIGGTCAAWFGGTDKSDVSESTHKRTPFSADMFGSVCYTFQHGKFTNNYNDLSRIDARLNVHSASAFFKDAGLPVSNISGGKMEREVDPLASPTLDVILQQQVAGPIVFRMDSRFSLGSSVSGKRSPRIEDVMYSLNYSLRALQSGKVVAWFSPKRKEGMVELRLFEF